MNNVRVRGQAGPYTQHKRDGVLPRNETKAVAMGLVTPDSLEVEDRPGRKSRRTLRHPSIPQCSPRERERERERGSLTTKKRMRQGASVCVYDGEHRPFRSYTLHLSLGLSPVGADGGRLSRQTLLSCSFSSTLRAAFFRGTEPVCLICKFPSTMEHGQSHGIVVVLPVSAATAATESLS